MQPDGTTDQDQTVTPVEPVRETDEEIRARLDRENASGPAAGAAPVSHAPGAPPVAQPEEPATYDLNVTEDDDETVADFDADETDDEDEDGVTVPA